MAEMDTLPRGRQWRIPVAFDLLGSSKSSVADQDLMDTDTKKAPRTGAKLIRPGRGAVLESRLCRLRRGGSRSRFSIEMGATGRLLPSSQGLTADDRLAPKNVLTVRACLKPGRFEHSRKNGKDHERERFGLAQFSKRIRRLCLNVTLKM